MNDARCIVGHAFAFSDRARLSDGRSERFARGAFSGGIDAGTALRVNHSGMLPLASVGEGSLHVEEDAYGLRFRAVLPVTAYGESILASIRSGRIAGVSVGFNARDEVREGVTSVVTAARLCEISLLTHGRAAYRSGWVDLRNDASLCRLRVYARSAMPIDAYDSTHARTERLRRRTHRLLAGINADDAAHGYQWQ